MKISGWPGTLRSGSTTTRPGRSSSTPSEPASGEALTPGRPDDRPGRDELARVLADRDPAGVDVGREALELGLDAQLVQRLLGRLRELLRERRQHPVQPLDQVDPGVAGVDRLELVGQRLPGDLGQRAGQLDAGRPGADHDEGQQRLALGRVSRALGGLEGVEDAAPDLQRVLDRLHARREGREVIAAEVVVAGPGGDDQVVVGQRRAVAELDLLRAGVDRGDPRPAGRGRCAAS